MTPGQAIKELRLKKGITQEELATKTDIKTRTIQRIENDDVKPRAYTVQRIAEALGVDFEKLTGIAEDNKAEVLLSSYVAKRNYGHVFLYTGILLLGIALGFITGVLLAKSLALGGETNEMIVLSLIVWVGIACIACFFLSRYLVKNKR